MKRVKVVVFWVGLVILATSAAGAASGVSTAAEPQKGRAARIKRGRAVYGERCARCHGADGQGRTSLGQMVEPPDLSDPAFLGTLSDERMIYSVMNGRAGMPAFKKKLSRQDIAATVAYVRTLKR